MKSVIIHPVDWVAYLAVCSVSVVAMVMISRGNASQGLLVALLDWLACCVASGVWFVLSEIADSRRARVKRGEK